MPWLHPQATQADGLCLGLPVCNVARARAFAPSAHQGYRQARHTSLIRDICPATVACGLEDILGKIILEDILKATGKLGRQGQLACGLHEANRNGNSVQFSPKSSVKKPVIP